MVIDISVFIFFRKRLSHMLYKNRKKFDKIGAAAGRRMSFMSPNKWTLISLVLAVVSSYFIATRQFSFAAIFFAFAALADLVDGAVARHMKSATQKGAFYDTISDRYVEFMVIVSLLLAGLPGLAVGSEIWIISLLFGSMMTTYARASAKRELGIEVKGGLVERGERLIILFVGLVSAALFGMIYLSYFVATLAVLSNVSALQRIASALRVK